MSIDLLLLALTIFSSLFLNLILETKEHLVAIGLVLNLLLLDKLSVLELQELFLRLQESLHLFLLRVQLSFILFAQVILLSFKPVFKLVLLLNELSFHLLQLHGVLINGLCLLIDLLLECPRDFHHVLLVLVDLLASLPYVFL